MRVTFIALFVINICLSKAQPIIISTEADKSLSVSWSEKQRLSGGVGWFSNNVLVSSSSITSKVSENVLLLKLNVKDAKIGGNDFVGIAFREFKDHKHGVVLWRYKPWNSWTKPIKITAPSDVPDWDVQFYYWQHSDGTYGAMVPLSGEGFRTTLGSQGNNIGSKAVALTDTKATTIPSLAISFGTDPYELFERIYRIALSEMGRGENLQKNKTFPEPLNYIGWCTWNSSDLGNNLNEDLLLKGAQSFTSNKFPLGWILADDGWFQHAGSQLQSYKPNTEKFPNGFKPVIEKLKKEYGLKYFGVWHAFNGYWNGIDPSSVLGKQFVKELFPWTQRERVDIPDSPLKTYHFIKPDSDSLSAFYQHWHKMLKGQGVDFIKVDNQLSTERMALNNYPVFSFSSSLHKALNASAEKTFNGAMINCMDMTAEAYLNFGTTAVARAVEDYFPYEEGEGYNLQRGNAAAHVLQGTYNNIYFSQMVYPDLDMFQSHNPNGEFHAIARAINNGPIYITDNIGEQKFAILNALVYSDGKIIKSETSLLPSKECLFQVQDSKLFKGFSKVRNAGLLGVWNAADANEVNGTVSPSDVNGFVEGEYLMYEHFSGSWDIMKATDKIDVRLGRLKYSLYNVVPVEHGFAAIGLVSKYNSPATVLRQKHKKNKVELTIYQGGLFRAYSKNRPSKVIVNGIATLDYKIDGKLLEVALKENAGPCSLIIQW